jgi:hypothetical protein
MKALLFSSRAIGFIIVFIFLVLVIAQIVMAIQDPESTSNLNKRDYISFALVFIASFAYFLSWRHEGLGGLIMVLSGLGISAVANWKYGIPFFVVGQLFVLYWYQLKSAKSKTSAKDKESKHKAVNPN